MRYGYPLGLCNTEGQTPRLQELVAWPRALELTRTGTPQQIYIGTSLWLHRPEQPFPWDRLDENRPLFYCALGSLVWFGKEKYRRFFQTIIDVARARPPWQWVRCWLELRGSRSFAPNIVIVKQAPQLDLLQRAHLMVTHCGANTIKECAFLAFP